MFRARIFAAVPGRLSIAGLSCVDCTLARTCADVHFTRTLMLTLILPLTLSRTQTHAGGMTPGPWTAASRPSAVAARGR